VNRVIIATPYKGKTESEIIANVEYARQAMMDSIRRGESPFAPHLLYPQVLDDGIRVQREMGMACGLNWIHAADNLIVYTDLGISDGMKAEIALANRIGLKVFYRSINHADDKDPSSDPANDIEPLQQ